MALLQLCHLPIAHVLENHIPTVFRSKGCLSRRRSQIKSSFNHGDEPILKESLKGKFASPNTLSFTSSKYAPRRNVQVKGSSQQETKTLENETMSSISENGDSTTEPSVASKDLEKEVQKVVRKTASTFAPRSSTASKNPAVPGTTLYTLFEVQGYLCMVVGGALSFNLLFPSNEPDIWRLMGMWSVWMFTIPSLRARDCSSKEKDALNYLFLAIPLINVLLPLIWKSFSLVWSADVLAFIAMYSWKLDWLSNFNKEDK